MVSKPAQDRLQISYDYWTWGRKAPHLLYANLDFEKRASPPDAGRLLRWLELCGPSTWEKNRTLQFLKRHQREFRHCLEWLSKNAEVDYGGRFADEGTYDEADWRQKWEQEPALRFLQHHGLDHGGITLQPAFQNETMLRGLQLSQKKPRDPLDPICWYMLSMLAFYGSVQVRRCRRWECGQFFFPRTVRRIFCSDSCRALDHVAQFDLDDLDEEGDGMETKKDKFRKKRAAYMREHRALPQVKKRE